MDKESVERGSRKTKTGTVIGNKMAKTLVVRVDRKYRHPVYSKIVTASKKYYAHVEESKGWNLGDQVTIVECRPISKLKRWRVCTKG